MAFRPVTSLLMMSRERDAMTAPWTPEGFVILGLAAILIIAAVVAVWRA